MCHKFHFDRGGAERYLFDLCRGLKSVGCEVLHFSTKDRRNLESGCEEFYVNNVDYDEALKKGSWLSRIKVARDAIYSFEARGKIEKLIEKHQPQIAHVHNIYHQISPSILSAFRKRDIPVVMTLHDYKIICPNYKLFSRGHFCEKCKGRRYSNCFLNRCLKDSLCASLLGAAEAYCHDLLKIYDQVDLFIAPSRFMVEKISEYGIAQEKILFLPHAIDLSGYLPKYDPGKYVVYAGRLIPEKGIRTFVESFKILPHVRAKILGDGPLRNELESFVLKHGLTHVEFLGHRSKSDLSAIMREALCVVVPSEWQEPAGLVIYEAFASGKCVIASRAGGIPELVEDGVNGMLFEAGNAGALAEKIGYVTQHPHKAREWGENGSLKIRQISDLKAHSMRIDAKYRELLGSGFGEKA